MVASLMRWLTPAALCALAFAATAQTPHSAARKADPLDASVAVPEVIYGSVLGRYRRADEAKAIPWRESNDTAARIGGWRTYAREAQQPEPAASTPAAPPSKPDPHSMPQGHGGHKMP